MAMGGAFGSGPSPSRCKSNVHDCQSSCPTLNKTLTRWDERHWQNGTLVHLPSSCVFKCAASYTLRQVWQPGGAVKPWDANASICTWTATPLPVSGCSCVTLAGERTREKRYYGTEEQLILNPLGEGFDEYGFWENTNTTYVSLNYEEASGTYTTWWMGGNQEWRTGQLAKYDAGPSSIYSGTGTVSRACAIP